MQRPWMSTTAPEPRTKTRLGQPICTESREMLCRLTLEARLGVRDELACPFAVVEAAIEIVLIAERDDADVTITDGGEVGSFLWFHTVLAVLQSCRRRGAFRGIDRTCTAIVVRKPLANRSPATAKASRRLFDANDPEWTGIVRFGQESFDNQSPCDTTKCGYQPEPFRPTVG
jgi:hypothetical protein